MMRTPFPLRPSRPFCTSDSYSSHVNKAFKYGCALALIFLSWVSIGQEVTLVEIFETDSSETPSRPTVRTGETILVPYFPATTNQLGRQGILRVVNLTDESGSVNVVAYDDDGHRHGPISLILQQNQSINVSSLELENGNPAGGVSSGTGVPKSGDWHLEITSDLDIQILSFVESSDGLLSPIHDTIPFDEGKHGIALFNPGSVTEHESFVRLVNPNDGIAEITIRSIDDDGAAGGKVQFSIPSRASMTLDAATLEQGGTGLLGRLGEGHGSWRLDIAADLPILVMNMLATSRQLANLSSRPISQHELDDAPVAPVVEVRDENILAVEWNHAVSANDNSLQAFDVLYRVGEEGLWREICRTWNLTEEGERTLGISLAFQDAFPDDTVVQARYRQRRNGQFCGAGLSHSWSSIGEASSSGSTDDHGNTPAEATSVGVPSNTDGEFEEGGDIDYFELVLSEQGSLTVETTGSTDTKGRLLDGDEDELASNDDSGSGTNFKIEQTVNAGTYYVEVRGFSSSTTGSYTFSVDFAAAGGGGGGTGTEGPDLTADQPTADDVNPDVDERFEVTIVVRNEGDTSSAATTVHAYSSSDSTISSSDREVASGNLRSLDAGEHFTFRVGGLFSSNPGVFYIGLCVDTVAGEQDTSNNCSPGLRITVSDDSSGGTNTTYEVGDTITTLPTGFWTTDKLTNGSYSYSNGEVTIRLDDDGILEEGDYRYTCDNSGGCRIVDRDVELGTIVESAL